MAEITKSEARWLEEAGIGEGHRLRRIGEVLHVWHTCGRCGGTGTHWAYHRDGGICYGCMGSKGRFVPVQGVAARARAAARKAAAAARERYEAPRRAAAAARAFLAETPGLAKALTANVPFVRDVARQLARRGRLAEKQVGAVLAAAEREANRPEPVDLQAGRQEIEGVVVRTKQVESKYGTTEKMLVELGPGARIFGTVPRSIDDVEAGARVRFTATVEPQEPGFGFFSRPTKAVLVEA